MTKKLSLLIFLSGTVFHLAFANHASPSFYVNAIGGGAYRLGHKEFLNNLPVPELNAKNWNHPSWCWTLGAALGYQFQKHYAIELGGFWTQKASLKIDPSHTWGNNLLGYTAAKLSVNASSNIELFGKVGVGINQMKFGSGLQPHFANQSSHSFIGPVYAIGSNYKISNHHNFAINLQYMRFGQSWTTWSAVHHMHANAMDLITVGVNYSFAA